MIFVFGSNEAGRHGKGAALFARQTHGAIQGIGYGRQGDSFGIPTKDRNLRVLDLTRINFYIEKFMAYAILHPELEFQVTNIGCGLAGYTPEQVAPLFARASSNCHFTKEFNAYLYFH